MKISLHPTSDKIPPTSGKIPPTSCCSNRLNSDRHMGYIDFKLKSPYPRHKALTKAHRAAGQYNGQEVYCGLSTASEVFLIFTTQPYQFLCIIMQSFPYVDKREVLQQEYSQHPILPSPHFWWVVNNSISLGKNEAMLCLIDRLVGHSSRDSTPPPPTLPPTLPVMVAGVVMATLPPKLPQLGGPGPWYKYPAPDRNPLRDLTTQDQWRARRHRAPANQRAKIDVCRSCQVLDTPTGWCYW